MRRSTSSTSCTSSSGGPGTTTCAGSSCSTRRTRSRGSAPRAGPGRRAAPATSSGSPTHLDGLRRLRPTSSATRSIWLVLAIIARGHRRDRRVRAARRRPGEARLRRGRRGERARVHLRRLGTPVPRPTPAGCTSRRTTSAGSSRRSSPAASTRSSGCTTSWTTATGTSPTNWAWEDSLAQAVQGAPGDEHRRDEEPRKSRRCSTRAQREIDAGLLPVVPGRDRARRRARAVRGVRRHDASTRASSSSPRRRRSSRRRSGS